jgi:hypothetical protein
VKKNVFASFGAPPLDVQKGALPTEQKRIAEELDQRVAERTGEPAAANQELSGNQHANRLSC